MPDSTSTPRSTSLRTSLVLRILLPLAVVVSAAAVLAVMGLEREVEARMQDEVELVARALRLPLTHAMELDRPGTVDRALRSALEIRRVYGVNVYGPEGEDVASFGEGWPGEPPERLTEMAAEGQRLGEYGSAGGRRVYSYFIPLADSWGRSLGVLQVTRRRRDIDDSIQRIRRQSAGLLFLGFAAVGVLILRGHHRVIGGPLDRLRESMARVRRGDRDHRAGDGGPRELAEVAVAFNAMLTAMEGAESELAARRRDEVELRRKLAHAEKLAAVGELASGVAHELGSPLSVIDGRAQRMLRRLPHPGVDPSLGDGLGAIRGQVRRMEGIVRQLLDFGRGETGTRIPTPVAGMVLRAVSAAAPEAEERDVRIRTRGTRPGPSLTLDARRMEEAVTNLVRNACQACGSQGGEVRVGWDEQEGEVRIEVEDDGPGIPPEIRSRIFEPFFTTKPTGQGTGLGLAVVHGIVDAHGGRGEADRSPLGGARLRILLPRAAGESDAEARDG